MNETLMFMVRHGYTVHFVWVFAEQIGLALPALLNLIAASALAGGLDGWRKFGFPLHRTDTSSTTNP